MNQGGDNVKIIIATHKKYRMPTDTIYLPLHVGAEGKCDSDGKELDLGYTKDNTGDNISEKNPYYCELTGLYWAWKNLDYQYIGLVHYRRHFSLKKGRKDSFDEVLNHSQLDKLLKKYRVILPKKRNYYIETLYSHYSHTHYAEHLDITRTIIAETYPDYLAIYDKVLKRRSGYMFNMMIMERSLMDSYCSWLFTILFELEKRVNAVSLSVFQGRFYGRVSEIIFNVWLEFQIENGIIKKTEVCEIPYVYMEKISWLRKISSFLMAKFFKKKYKGSF